MHSATLQVCGARPGPTLARYPGTMQKQTPKAPLVSEWLTTEQENVRTALRDELKVELR